MADNDEPRIIIDEDWKTQVEREKEQARKAAETQEEPAADPDEPGKRPPTAFENLAGFIGTQAMFSLGLIAPQGVEEVMVNLEEARFLIDMMGTLRDKTKGNLTPQEEGYLTGMIADLQRAFVGRSQQLQETALNRAGFDPNRLKA